MNPGNEQDMPEPIPPAQEGAFDAQLSFPEPFTERPRAFTVIIKRDGREEGFDRLKIAGGIFRAAQSIDGKDTELARNLAVAVTLYLAKALGQEKPTVEHVTDAVERVLVEMGHMRTAMAYVRYRDRRNELRRLRGVDARAVLKELTGDSHTETFVNQEGDRISVRASDQTVAGWSRGKIIDGLIRETGLDPETADRIAAEVEDRIRAANLSVLTTALVRELVGATLIEHGLERHQRRQMRLGVPLNDAERIICSPNSDTSHGSYDPELTNRVLAERVKQEFALTQVFSQDVADAHSRGDVHLHNLGFIDRLHSLQLPLEHIKRFGITAPTGNQVSPPAQQSETLIAHLAGSTTALRHHFTGAVTWDALNFMFAPFLQHLPDSEVRESANVLAYEFAYRALSRGDQGPPVKMTLSWEAPEHLTNIEATGPGGEATERTYPEYLHTAQQIAWALIDVYREVGTRPNPIATSTPVVVITPEFFRMPGHERFLEHAAQLVSTWGNIEFSFNRENPVLPYTEDILRPRHAVAHRVTLNLARAAFRSTNEATLVTELSRLVNLALKAHSQKRTFVHKLMALKNAGPLGQLAVEREGQPFLDIERGQFVVGLTGLNECIQHLLGHELHESNDAIELAERLLAHLRNRCMQSGNREGLNVCVSPVQDSGVAHRFAELDLSYYGNFSKKVVKSGGDRHEVRYTPGTGLNTPSTLSPMERIRLESRLHPFMGREATTVLPKLDPDTSPSTIASLIKMAYQQTTCRRIAFE